MTAQALYVDAADAAVKNHLRSSLSRAFSRVTAPAVLEAAIVLTVLLGTAMLGGKFTDWTGALAVFATFLHGQLSFDMQESQGQMVAPTVANYHWSGRLFVSKEVLWIFTFLMTGSWSLCAGSLIFATYPRWRAFIRKGRPLEKQPAAV